MATFHSRKHPSLVVKFADRTAVRFTDGTAEVDVEAAEKLASFAERHPDYEIERVEDGSEDKPLTPKQQAQARARELGLDDSGSKADIEARIAAHEADEQDEIDEQGEGDEQDSDESDDA